MDLNKYQRYLEINGALEQLLINFMNSNNIDPLELDGAISKFQLKLKDQIVSLFLIEAQNQSQTQEEINTEEDIDG